MVQQSFLQHLDSVLDDYDATGHAANYINFLTRACAAIDCIAPKTSSYWRTAEQIRADGAGDPKWAAT